MAGCAAKLIHQHHKGVGIAIRKQDAELKQKLDKALAAIRANGKYDELRKKYFDYDIYGE